MGCTHCGQPTPKCRKTCSAQCLQARRGESARIHKGTGKHHACEHCNSQFPHRRNNTTNRFCTRACAFAHKRKNKKGESCSIWCGHCVICGNAFVSRMKRQHCGRGCELAALREKQRAICHSQPKPRWPQRECVECGTRFTPNHKARKRFCSVRCAKTSGSRQARHARRLRLTINGDREQVDLAVLVKRDGNRCQICGGKIEATRKYDPLVFQPLAVSVDHIVPVSEGGEHSYANTQLAHIICNSLRNRGDRMVQTRLCG